MIAKSELDVAEAKLNADKATIEQAQSAVQSANNHISYTSIRAPFDGITDRIHLKAGSLVEEGTLLTNISDISQVFAYFSFPETEYLRYERARREVITAQRDVLTAELELANIKRDVFISEVNLYRALGGGWR